MNIINNSADIYFATYDNLPMLFGHGIVMLVDYITIYYC